MDLKQLEIFISVANEQSFSGAARKLSLTQPAVSAQISSLEKELGARLIDRNKRSLRLTVKGCRLYDKAVKMMSIRDSIYDDFIKPDKKIINIGASTIPSSYILPHVLSAFGRINPDIYFNSQLAQSDRITEMVHDGSIDFGLTGFAADDHELESVPFLEDTLVIAAPVNRHYLDLLQSGASLHDMVNEPFILRDSRNGKRKEMDRVLEENDIDSSQLNVSARMNDLEAIKRSISGGLGISVISRIAVQDMYESRRILIFPISSPPPKRQYYLVRRRFDKTDPAAARFMNFLRSYYSQRRY